MAVHNEQSLRSFPSFCEAENFEDDDDGDSNFIISLEDSSNEDEQISGNITAVCASLPHNITVNLDTSTHTTVPCSIDAQNIYTVSDSAFSSSTCNREISACPQIILPAVKNVTQAELQPSIYSTSKENQQGSFQHSSTGDVVHNPSCPVPGYGAGKNCHKKVATTVSCSSGTNATAFVTKHAKYVNDSCKSLEETASPHMVHSESENAFQDKSTHSGVALQKLSRSSEWPKMRLETIHLDKEACGIWSEAVILNTDGMSDSSLDNCNDPSEKVSFEGTNNDCANQTRLPFVTSSTPLSSCNFTSVCYSSPISIPKLSGPHYRFSSPETGTECSVGIQANSTVVNLSERVLKMPSLEDNTTCTCIMCYKGSGIVAQCTESQNEAPSLTEEEQLLIFKGPVKRKKQSPTIEIKKKRASLSFCNYELTCQPLTVNSPVKTQSVLNGVSNPYDCKAVAATVHATQHMTILDSHKTILAIQPKSLTSDASAHGNLLADTYNIHKSTNRETSCENITTGVSVGIKRPHLQCEIPTTVTAASNVTSVVAANPNVRPVASFPRIRSYPTKVFLKPSEVPGQRTQSLLSTSELPPTNKLSWSKSGSMSSIPVTVASAQTSLSPSTFSSPPNYKIIYVSSDQVLVCPNQTNTPVSLISVSQHNSHMTQLNSKHVTVLNLPQTSIQNKILSSDSRLISHALNIAQNSQLSMNKSGNINLSSLSPVTAIDTSKELSYVLKNAEKVDITRPGKVLIKLKQSPIMHGPQTGHVQTSQQSPIMLGLLTGPVQTSQQSPIINGSPIGHVQTSPVINVTAGANAVSPVSKGSVYLTPLMKDFKSPIIKNMEPTAPNKVSEAYSLITNTSHLTTTVKSPVVPKPKNLEVTQALMSLIKSHFKEQPSAATHNILVNLLKAGLQTSESHTLNASHHNIKVSGSDISKKLQTLKPKEVKQIFKSSSERSKPEETKSQTDGDNVSSPHLPQEGLPSTYIEDWINQTKTYMYDHLKESDCLPEPQNMNQSVTVEIAPSHHKAFTSSPTENTKGYVHLRSRIKSDTNSSILESQGERETLVLPKLATQSQLLSRKPTCAQVQNLQILPTSTSDSSHIFSESSSVQISSVSHISTLKQTGKPNTSKMAGGQGPRSFSLQKSQALPAPSQKPSCSVVQNCAEAAHIPTQLTCKSPALSDFCRKNTYRTPKASLLSSSSSLVDSSKGIKLKIKLGELRKKGEKFKQSFNALKPIVRNGECLIASQPKSESLQKGINTKGQDALMNDAEKLTEKSTDGDKTETAEEMFQRFQEQAMQEVIKARMGMGYVSRSLRPARTTMAFIDKYPYRFGPGRPKKSEKNVLSGLKITEDSNNCSTPDMDEKTDKNDAQSKKSSVSNKRQTEEASNKEIKVKQPKLSIKDHPRLKQDCSITNRKKVFCSNILAGHKVYVKFNTFENTTSGRAFLVPFFNIGGTRTQFDVEDMEYINEAVLEFEKEERSCARHLLFYAREGHKAVFLRKETHFQTSHISDKNYRKCSFILEGFTRDTRKPAEPSPELWKVDNTIDIEIDRAEIDNDVEIEFDANMTCAEVTSGFGVNVEHTENDRVKTKDTLGTNAGEWSSLPAHGSHSRPVKAVSSGSVNHEALRGGQTSSLKTCVNLGSMIVEDVLSADITVHKIHREKDNYDSQKEMMATVSVTPALSDSILCGDEHTEQLQELMSDFPSQGAGRNRAEVLLENSSTCTVPKKEVMAYEDGNQYPVGPVFFSAWVKQEQPDARYEDSTEQLDSTQTAVNNCSMHLSPASTSNLGEQVLNKCSVFVKTEPVDEYFNSSVEIEPCSSKSYQIEHSERDTHSDVSQHVKSLSCSQVTGFSKIPSDQQRSLAEFVNGTSEKEVSASSSLAGIAYQHSEICALNSQSTNSNLMQSQAAELSTLPLQSVISRLKVVHDTASTKPEMRNSKNCNLTPSPRNVDTELSTCNFVDDSVSTKTVSITEPSLPESPLPSSSLSESSEISASSGIDDKHISAESDYSADSHTSLLNPEDGNTENKQNNVQNKITSLVESLRNRLTHETSNLPPWLASINTSVTSAKVKRRKRLKTNVEKEKSLDIIPAETQSFDNVSTSAGILSTTSEPIASHSFSSPMVSPLNSSTISCSLNQVDSQSSLVLPLPLVSRVSSLPADSASLVTICTPTLPVDILQSIEIPENTAFNSSGPSPENIPKKSQMLLPVHLPKEKCTVKYADASQISPTDDNNHSPIVIFTSNKVINTVTCSETESLIELNDVSCGENYTPKIEVAAETKDKSRSNQAFENNLLKKHDTSDQYKATLSNCEHIACSEAVNSYRLSPIDFEIEVGKEDLPETALSLQPILPNEDLNIEALKVNRRNRSKEHGGTGLQIPLQQSLNEMNHLQSLRLETDRTEQKKQHINGQSHLDGYDINHSEVFEESEKHKNGSVASYLSQKFLFSGEGNNIKGPRLLHMRASRKVDFTEAGDQKTQKQNTRSLHTVSEPITTAELSKTPSVVEIFGASVGKEAADNPDTKIDSLEFSTSHIPLSNNSGVDTDQKIVRSHFHPAQLTTKKASKRKKRKNTRCVTNALNFRATSVKANLATAVIKPLSEQHHLSPEAQKTELNSEIISRMHLCKVVLTKLEKLGNLNKLSENVFIIQKEPSKMTERTQGNRLGKLSDGSFNARSSKATFRKVVKKKRKKTMKVTRNPGLRSKKDIVEYYAFMLETLQKKAQQLEEETRRKEAEEHAKQKLLESTKCDEAEEGKISTIINEKGEKTETSSDNKRVHEDIKTESVLEQCDMKAGMDCSLQGAMSNNSFTTSAQSEAPLTITTDEDVQTGCEGSLLEHEIPNGKVGENEKADDVGLADYVEPLNAQTEVSDISNSDWPYLQKFCDETIFYQGSTGYLQKVSGGVCFPKMIAASAPELQFGKKDIVLGSSVSDDAVHAGELSTSETFNETEDTDGCMMQCIDEQEGVHMDEDEMLLGLDIQKSSALGHDDHESTRNPFLLGVQADTMHESSDIDNESIVASSVKSADISLEENMNPSTADEGTLLISVPKHVSCPAEPRDDRIITESLNCTPYSCTATASSQTPRVATGTNVEVSPSWERLLGHKSLSIKELSGDGNISSHPEEPANQSISFVASSNFKLKFKLPKGFLSRAVKTSRDMKNVFEEPTSDNSSLGNLQVSTNSSLDQAFENGTNPQNEHRVSRPEDCLAFAATQTIENLSTPLTSQMPVPKLKFSPVTLTAIRNAKAEFLQRRNRGRKSKQGHALKRQSNDTSIESVLHPVQEADFTSKTSDSDKSSAQHQESSDDSVQKLQPNNVRSSHEHSGSSNLFPGSVSCDISLKEGSGPAFSNHCASESGEFKQINIDSAIQTKDINFPESVLHVSKNTTDNVPFGVSLKQSRKDGIFSNLDLFQGLGEEHIAQQTSEPSSNKEGEVYKIMKTNVIDISKLKLKLNPLISNKLKEKAAETSIEASKFMVLNEVLPHNRPENMLLLQEDHKSQEHLDQQAVTSENDSPDGLNYVQTNECPSEKLRANNPGPQLDSSSTGSSGHLSTQKPVSQINAAKLCSILKNFHRNTSASSFAPTSAELIIPGVGCKILDKTQSTSMCSPSSLHSLEKSNQLSTLASTSEVGTKAEDGIRLQKAYVNSVTQKKDAMVGREMRKAKEKAKQKILTTNSVKVTLHGKLSTGHEDNVCENEKLNNDDKGERSFFDCLSSVPLNVWEEKKD